MDVRYIRYNKETGYITSIRRGLFKNIFLKEDEDYFEITEKTYNIIDTRTFYFDIKNKEIKRCTKIPIEVDKYDIKSDGEDASIITIPELKTNDKIVYPWVKVEKEEFIQITDGIFEFSTIKIGKHKLFFTATNYMDMEVNIRAYEV